MIRIQGPVVTLRAVSVNVYVCVININCRCDYCYYVAHIRRLSIRNSYGV